MFQTNEARQEFLCNGPGGLAGQKTFVKAKEKSAEANDEITVETKDKQEEPVSSIQSLVESYKSVQFEGEITKYLAANFSSVSECELWSNIVIEN